MPASRRAGPVRALLLVLLLGLVSLPAEVANPFDAFPVRPNAASKFGSPSISKSTASAAPKSSQARPLKARKSTGSRHEASTLAAVGAVAQAEGLLG